MIIEGVELSAVTIAVDPAPTPETFWFYSYQSNIVGAGQTTEEFALDSSKNIYTHAYLSGNLFGYNKIDSLGNSQTFNVYSNVGNSFPATGISWSISTDGAGNVFRTQKLSPSANVAWAKFDTSGQVVFAKKVSRPDLRIIDLNDSAAETAGGNFYVAGRSFFESAPDVILPTVVKINQYTGNIVWSKYYTGASNNANYEGTFNKIRLASDGNIWAIGQAENPVNQVSGIGVFKIDKSTGDPISQYIYTSSGAPDSGKALGVDNEGNLVVAGLAGESAIILKIRGSNGAILWQKTTSGFDQINGTIGIDTSNDIYIGTDGTLKLVKLHGANGAVDYARVLSYGADSGIVDVAVNGVAVYIGSSNGGNRALLGKLPANGAGTGTYVGSGGANISYTSSIYTLLAGDATMITGNRVSSNLAFDLADISSTRTNYSNVTITLNTVS